MRFDLSGLAMTEEGLYAIADKHHDPFIYEIVFDGSYWKIKNKLEISIGKKLDIEGIDACNQTFYIVDERSSSVFLYDGDWSEFKINSQEYAKEIKLNINNNGLEGIAVNCEKGKIYLAKERQPRFILELESGTGKVLQKFSIPETHSNDFADLKYENGHLYILERNAYLISKVSLETYKVVEKISFKSICGEEGIKLYEPAKYGMAEAILLLEDEIWIGLDNNSLNVSDFGRESYGISGNKPSILKFKRPDGF